MYLFSFSFFIGRRHGKGRIDFTFCSDHCTKIEQLWWNHLCIHSTRQFGFQASKLIISEGFPCIFYSLFIRLTTSKPKSFTNWSFSGWSPKAWMKRTILWLRYHSSWLWFMGHGKIMPKPIPDSITALMPKRIKWSPVSFSLLFFCKSRLFLPFHILLQFACVASNSL